MARNSKPQLTIEATPELQAELDLLKTTHGGSKRHHVESAIRNYTDEKLGRRLVITVPPSVADRVKIYCQKDGRTLDWVLERALNEFLVRRGSLSFDTLIVDLTDRMRRRLRKYWGWARQPDISRLVEDGLDLVISQDLRERGLEEKFNEALDEPDKRDAN